MPRICTTLFEQIDENSRVKTDTRCEVTFSMLEIYNEKVRDLLEKGKGASELKIREHNRGGFYGDFLHLYALSLCQKHCSFNSFRVVPS